MNTITITQETAVEILSFLKRLPGDETAARLVKQLERKAEIGERLVISNYEGRGNLAIKDDTLCDLVGFEERDGLDMLKVNIHLPYEDANGLVWMLTNGKSSFALYVHPHEVQKFG